MVVMVSDSCDGVVGERSSETSVWGQCIGG